MPTQHESDENLTETQLAVMYAVRAFRVSYAEFQAASTVGEALTATSILSERTQAVLDAIAANDGA